MNSPVPPVNVNPGDIEITASSLQALTAELGGAIPAGVQVTVFPTGAATALIHANTAAATAAMQARLGVNAAGLNSTGQQYQGADQHNGQKLALKEIGLGEVGQLIGAFVQPIGQELSALTGGLSQVVGAGLGTLGGLAQAGEGPLTGVIGAVSSANIQHPGGHTSGNPDVGPQAADLQTPDNPVHTPTLHIPSTHQTRA